MSNRLIGIFLLYGTPYFLQFFFLTYVVKYAENDGKVKIWRSDIVLKLLHFKVIIYYIK
jgi:hypothetical protein